MLTNIMVWPYSIDLMAQEGYRCYIASCEN